MIFDSEIRVGYYVPEFCKLRHFGSGGFSWPVNFELEKPASANGAIIQEINISYSHVQYQNETVERMRTVSVHKEDTEEVIKVIVPILQQENVPVLHLGFVKTKNGVRFVEGARYWEAWPIKIGSKTPYYFCIRLLPDDIYRLPPLYGTAGSLSGGGIVGLYYGELPNDFQQTDWSGLAKATKIKPPFWAEKGMVHKVHAEWDSINPIEPKNPGELWTSQLSGAMTKFNGQIEPFTEKY